MAQLRVGSSAFFCITIVSTLWLLSSLSQSHALISVSKSNGHGHGNSAAGSRQRHRRQRQKHNHWSARNALSRETGAVGDNLQENKNSKKAVFPRSSPPYLAIITELDSCDDETNMKAALTNLHAAVSTGMVDLVSVRVNVLSSNRDLHRNVVSFTRQLMEWSDECSFRVVLSSDWVDAAVEANAHGVHVKESHRHRIPEIRSQFSRGVGGVGSVEPQEQPRQPATHCLIGTSAHSVESATSAFEVHRPDYMFVGTCYTTQSHPEKSALELEGPELPGKICRALEQLAGRNRPKVLAIGGIDASNCHVPVVKFGADGVATIRAVLAAEDPADSVRSIRANMIQGKKGTP
jgi:thiamine monophosphate synthase